MCGTDTGIYKIVGGEGVRLFSKTRTEVAQMPIIVCVQPLMPKMRNSSSILHPSFQTIVLHCYTYNTMVCTD